MVSAELLRKDLYRASFTCTPRMTGALAAALREPRRLYLDDTGERAGHPGVLFRPYFEQLELQGPHASPAPGALQTWVRMELPRALQQEEVFTVESRYAGARETARGLNYWRELGMVSDDDGARFVVTAGASIRGASLEGSPFGGEEPGWLSSDVGARGAWSITVPIESYFPNLFAECAGTFNPIHLSEVAAAGIGLPGRPYQGIALVLEALREVVDAELDGDPRQVRELGMRFRKPVYPGSTIEIRCGVPVMRGGRDRWELAILLEDSVIASEGYVEAGRTAAFPVG